MKITEITVHASRTLPHPVEDYANIRPSVTLKAEINGDDPLEATKELQRKAEMLVEEHSLLLTSSLKERDVLEREANEIRQLESSMHRQTQRLEELKEQHEVASTPDWLTFPAETNEHESGYTVTPE